MSDTQTLGLYASRGKDYLRLMEEHAADDPYITRFIDLCPAGGQVLDLGCGPGAYALRMAKAGLQVDAWDAVPELLSHIPALPGLKTRCARFGDLTAENHYDGIWAYFSLLHAPRAEFPGHIAALRRALKPGGTLFLGMKLGTGGKRDRLGRYYEYYSVEELEDHLRHNDLQPQAHWCNEAQGFDGTPSSFVVIHARG